MIIALLAVVGGILFMLYRFNNAVQTTKDFNHNTKGLQRQARNAALDVFGTRLQRIQDPRLAAVILMLQLVRTGAPVTAAEKTQIMELMEDPLQIANIETIFVRAWGYTEQNRVFSPVADELVPLFRKKLSPNERLQLLAMLMKVANAYTEASELQIEAIARLKTRLMMDEERFVSPVERPL